MARQRQGVAEERGGQVRTLFVSQHQLAVGATAADVDLDHVAVESDGLGNLCQRVIAKSSAVAAMRNV